MMPVRLASLVVSVVLLLAGPAVAQRAVLDGDVPVLAPVQAVTATDDTTGLLMWRASYTAHVGNAPVYVEVPPSPHPVVLRITSNHTLFKLLLGEQWGPYSRAEVYDAVSGSFRPASLQVEESGMLRLPRGVQQLQLVDLRPAPVDPWAAAPASGERLGMVFAYDFASGMQADLSFTLERIIAE